MSLATTLNRSKGGQFIAHAKALPGNPYDGHTLAAVIPEIETQIGANLTRIVADRGYRGHNAPPEHKFKVYISGQRRRVTETIKRELRRRPAVEPVIGHAKAEHRMGRNYLAGTQGDAANAVLAAAGYNFRRLLEWLSSLAVHNPGHAHRPGRSEIAFHRRVTAFFTVDLFGNSARKAIVVDTVGQWSRCGKFRSEPLPCFNCGVAPRPSYTKRRPRVVGGLPGLGQVRSHWTRTIQRSSTEELCLIRRQLRCLEA